MYNYVDISKSEIYLIKDLWTKNRDFHKEKSKIFFK